MTYDAVTGMWMIIRLYYYFCTLSPCYAMKTSNFPKSLVVAIIY